MTEPEQSDILTYPFYEMEPYSDITNPPRRVILREIDFDLDKDEETGEEEMKFYFSGGEDLTIASQTAFEDLINKVADPKYAFKKPAPVQNAPYASTLSLNNGKLSYVVYKLSNAKRWQVSRSGLPVSVGAKGQQFCFDGYRVGAAGYISRDRGRTERNGDKIVYFIADGWNAFKNGTTGLPSFPINIHVDLVFSKEAGGPRYIPLIIDPDIRYPGGSGINEGP